MKEAVQALQEAIELIIVSVFEQKLEEKLKIDLERNKGKLQQKVMRNFLKKLRKLRRNKKKKTKRRQ